MHLVVARERPESTGGKKYFSAQFGQSALEKPSFWFLLSERQGPPVGVARIGDSPEPAAQVGSSRVRQMVVRKLTIGEQGVY
jgi:hypothetical protein